MGLAIGICLFAIAITKEIQHILHSINEKARTNENQSNELKVLFTEYIKTHAAIKQLSITDNGNQTSRS